MRGVQGNIHKFLHAQAKAPGKALKKSPAASGTGLVEAHVADNAVIHLEAFHVLAAYVYDIADLRHKARGRLEVGQGFHQNGIHAKGGFRQMRAVARSPGCGKPCPVRDTLKHVCQRGEQGL